MKLLFKLAFLQITRNYRYSALLVMNLVLGMSSFLLLVSIKDSVLNSVYQRSQKYLGADIVMYSRQDMDLKALAEAESLLPLPWQRVRMQELYTMVKGPDRSRLTLLVAIEKAFPFYGEFRLQNRGVVKGGEDKSILDQKRVWVYPEVIKQLGLKVGDPLRIGEAEFVIDDVVVEASGQSSGWAAMAPLVYMSFDSLEATGLVQKGSTVWRSFLYQIPLSADVMALERDIDQILKSPALKVQSHIRSGEQASRLVLYFMDFLGLSGLVVLFLAAMGVYFVFQSNINGQIQVIAVWKAIGLRSQSIKILFFIQFLGLSLFAYLLAILLVVALLPVMNLFLHELSFFDLHMSLSSQSLFLSAIILLTLSFFISWPVVHGLTRVQVKSLFGEQVQEAIKWSWSKISLYFPLILTFGFLSVWTAKSWITGGVFWASWLLIIVVATALWLLWVRALTRFIMPLKWAWYFKSWMRRPLPTLLVFLSLTMSVLLINFLIFIEGQIDNELMFEGSEARPTLFIFDIQEEQVEAVRSVARNFQFEFNNISPMIRAKLTKVNGINFEKLNDSTFFETREREREERFRNRGMNLSYREHLTPAETVIAGEEYMGTFAGEGLPPISLERRFAERLNLKLHDKMTFEVQGVEVEGVIRSLRNIRWTSFEPNFFIQFPTGVLELAPKTFIATTPSLDEETKEQFQSELFEVVPNASVIDVTRLIGRIDELIKKMALTLKAITLLSLICGFLIIASISQHQIRQKSRDIILLKWLGLTQSRMLKLYIFEFSLIAFLSSCLALLLSQLMTWAVGRWVFQSFWWGQSPVPYWNILGVTAVSAFIVYTVVKSLFKRRIKVLSDV